MGTAGMEMSVAEYLTAAEVQYGVGNHSGGRGFDVGWPAQATFMSLGRARGLECADLIELAKSLEIRRFGPQVLLFVAGSWALPCSETMLNWKYWSNLN